MVGTAEIGLVIAIALLGCHVEVTSAPDATTMAVDASSTADAAEELVSDGAAADSTVLPPGDVPIMIAARNYHALRDQLLGYGPFMVYAWATNPALDNPANYQQELDLLAAIDDADVEELIMFSSYRTLADKLTQSGHIDYLRSIGVSGVGFNSEGMMTPSDEMNSLGDTQAATNAVALFAAIATGHDLEVLWGPIRVTADAVGDGAVSAMIGAGLAGVGLQEQQFIESACVGERVAAVAQTSARYKGLAAGLGRDAHVNVQVMPSRCLAGDTYAASNCGASAGPAFTHCADFVAQITDEVDSIAIWASGPDDVSNLVALIAALRAN